MINIKNLFALLAAGFVAAAVHAQVPAFPAGFRTQNVSVNGAFLAQGKLAMPVLALGGEKSFGPMMATVMQAAANDVTEGLVPDSGHWIMEENPTDTVKAVRGFLYGAK